MTSVTNRFCTFVVLLISGAGAMLSSTTAQGGDLASWSKNIYFIDRFESLSEFDHEAVLDAETQLVWLKSPLRTPVSWSKARDFCLNQSVSDGWSRRYGWRLPSAHELGSLYFSYWDASVLPFNGLRRNIDFRELAELWTATSVAEDVFHPNPIFGQFGPSSDAYAYSFRVDGGVEKRQKNEKLGVVCVRGWANSAQH